MHVMEQCCSALAAVARQGHRPPRPQAREHLSRARAAATRTSSSCSTSASPSSPATAGSRTRRAPASCIGTPRVHEPGAVRGQGAHRPALRRLLARHHAVRAAHRARAVPGRRLRRDPRRAPDQAARAAVDDQSRRHAAARSDRDALDREGPQPPLPDDGGVPGGHREPRRALLVVAGAAGAVGVDLALGRHDDAARGWRTYADGAGRAADDGPAQGPDDADRPDADDAVGRRVGDDERRHPAQEPGAAVRRHRRRGRHRRRRRRGVDGRQKGRHDARRRCRTRSRRRTSS